ncbi:hypothetical protein IWX63_002534 [Arthrobacter sp. CAN_A2]
MTALAERVGGRSRGRGTRPPGDAGRLDIRTEDMHACLRAEYPRLGRSGGVTLWPDLKRRLSDSLEQNNFQA